MRPYLIVTGDFVSSGGMDAANLALASHLADTGCPLHLAAHRIDPALRRPGVAYHHVPKPLDSYLLGAPLLRRAGARIARTLGDDAATIANGGSFLRGNVNWLHYVHAAHEPALAGNALRRAVSAWSRRGFLADERAAVARAQLLIANSERTRRDAIALLGAEPARVHTVYYGTDPQHFRPPSAAERARARAALQLAPDDVAVAFVGALGDRRKGFDLLLQAWAQAGDMKLLVAGGGQELPAWRARVAAAGMAGRVRFLGFHRDVRGLLWASDLLAAPSRYEAYGLAAHEALCCGVPVVTASDAGIAERFGEALRPLLLHDVEDAQAMPQVLLRWRGGQAAFRAAAAAAGEQLRQRTWSDMAREIVSLVEAELG